MGQDIQENAQNPDPGTMEVAERASFQRGRPLGGEDWTLEMAQRLDLQYTLNPRGRPRNAV